MKALRVNSEKGKESESPSMPVSYLMNKIADHFGFTITEKQSNKHDIAVWSRNNDREAVTSMVSWYSKTSLQKRMRFRGLLTLDETALVKATTILRSAVLQVQKYAPSLPSIVTTDDLRNGQASTLDILIKALYSDPNKPPVSSSTRCRILSSSCVDLCAVTNGMLKQIKHLCLGMSVKSMTVSCKIVEMLNHL